MEDSLGVIRVAYLRTHTHDVAALLHKVLNVIISTLVRQLGHLNLFTCKLLIQVEKVQSRWRQVLHARQEYGCLQLGHGGLELGRDQGKRFMFYSKRFVKVNTFWNQIRIKVVEPCREERSKIFGYLIALLQTGAEAVGQGSNVGNMVVLTDLGLLLHVTLELGLPVLAEQPLENGFLNLLVVFVLEELIGEKLH